MKASREYGRGATSAGHGSHRFLLSKRTRGTRTATRFAIGRAATARKLALVLAGALALMIAASGGASAAAPTVNEHTMSTKTFPEEICGVPGTSTLSVVENFKLFADGTFLDTISSREVFTATQSGKSVLISVDRQESGPAEPIQNADGTITFITTFKGLPEKLSINNGPTLLRNAGTVTLADTFLPLPNGDLQFVSETVSGEHGQLPDLDSGFELFCDVLIPALT
jgi:hypothetical protein